ncbi:TFIIB-type zinc ribbon-containing protein [Actinacidiphila bryophytorum]|uniref:Zf-TFIIB domain-containing protein n=1 Tax=Actinacidiphila bryophytorum TaxID=1436133 RepID=A0A9W4MFH4_9ACTN|nr:zf-TFIIB domain-containing protein [Actinacidiphila bryophytorum]MBM9439474.1 zf-TFIIB domain-containing protein [Actinacidiphila bryophytorum]MBN6546271.1 zf-TFIIB domain-containing protein [Actinacidiphila bryophytorum]CAG7655116.1 zf-TFIIB domain-containing protein [Actinacidiphila bryophytorum]
MVCPKCHGHMQTYNRSGVQIEQCGNCRGIFLDYGELEALTQLEGQWNQPAPPPQAYPAPHVQPGYPQPPAPAWGAPQYGHGHGHGHKHHKHGFGHMLFSS